MGLSLIVVTGKMAGQSLGVDKETLIGRSSESDIRLTNVEVSRRHCKITPNDELVIEDLGSLNGTYVNAEKIKEPKALKDGDVITVCDTRFVVVHEMHTTPNPEITTIKEEGRTTMPLKSKSSTQEEADKALKRLFENR